MTDAAGSFALVNAIIGAVNLAALLAIAFHGGRWMGRIETGLTHVDRRITDLEQGR